MRKHRFFLSLLTGAMVCSGMVLSGIGPAHMKGNYKTEHIQWGVPGKDAKKKVLFFTYFSDGVGRYPAELAQRYNLDYETAYFSLSGKQAVFLGADEGMGRAEELIRRGNWNAFVFWGCSPSDLLGSNQKAYMLFLQQVVRNGAGLIIVDGDNDPKTLKEKNKLSDVNIPLYGENFPVEFYKVGKGRGAYLSNFDTKTMQAEYFRYQKKRPIEYSEGWRDQYEMRLGDVYSALAWSMGKPNTPPVFSVADGKLSVIANANGKLEVFVRGAGDQFELATGKNVKNGETVLLDMPPLLPGKYLIGGIIRENGKSGSFGGILHEVKENPNAKINFIQLEPAFGKTGAKITGKVNFQGGKDLTLRLRDPQRRILLEKPVSGDTFEFVLESFLPHLVTVEVTLSEGGKELDRDYVYCKKTIDRTGRFDMMAWGYHEFAAASMDVNARLEELGINELVGFAPALSPCEILYMPPRGGPLRIRNARNDNECWLSPELMEAKKKEFATAFQETARSGMKRIMFGDEGPVQLGCLSTHCTQAYREWLKDKYKNLDALNKAWKTSFTAWDQVGVSMIPEKNDGKDLAEYGKQIYRTPDSSTRNHAINTWGVARPRDWNQLVSIYKTDANAREYYNDQFLLQDCGSMLAKNYTRWFDRCSFRSYVMAAALKKMDTLVNEVHPGTKTGLSGTVWIGCATNFDNMLNSMSCAMTYSRLGNGNPVTDLIDALVPADYAGNSWTGYAKTPEPLISETWSDQLSHPNMFSIYSVFSSPPAYWGILRPDLATNVPDQGLIDSTYKLRNGIGDVLMRSKKQFDPIVVLWSWPSVWASRLEGGETFQLPEDSFTGALAVLNAMGLRFKFVTAHQLETGKASLKPYQILLLPRIDAMGETLAGQIREFAKNGGTVIADVRPGVFGPNLEMLKNGVLDKEFGIQRSAPGIAKSAALNMTGADGTKFDLDSSVRLAGGKALFESPEKIPAFIENACGKGKFVLLNFAFYSLPSLNNPEFASGSGAEFIRLFSRIPPVCAYSGASGSPRYGIRNVSWQNGDMVWLFAHDPAINAKKNVVKGTLNGKAQYIFDVNAGKQRFKSTSFEFELAPPQPAVFILSDSILPNLTLSAPSDVQPGTVIDIAYNVDGKMKGLRPAVLTLEFKGKPVPGFRHVLLAEPEAKVLKHCVAWNEAKGKYMLVLYDILTDSKSKLTFTVK